MATATMKEVEEFAHRSLKKWIKIAYSEPQLRARVWRRDAKKQAVPFHVDLTLCTAPKMTELNQIFRGIKKPTDVLSFPVVEFFQLQGYLGDLVICYPVLIKQATELKLSWKKEADTLIVHGLLHLLGFDHETTPADAKLMAKWEKKLLGLKTKGLISRA